MLSDSVSLSLNMSVRFGRKRTEPSLAGAIVHEIEKRLSDSDMAAAVGKFVRWLRGG